MNPDSKTLRGKTSVDLSQAGKSLIYKRRIVAKMGFGLNRGFVNFCQKSVGWADELPVPFMF